MVDFGGWEMPVEYPGPGGGLIAEHLAVRTAVGLFDVSHMGEIQFRGPGALAAVQHITMNDASRLKDGQAHYSALLTPQGDVRGRHPGPPPGRERLPAGGERGNQGQGLRVDSAAGGRVARHSHQRLLQLLLATRAAGTARTGDAQKADEGGPGGDQELLVHLGQRWRASEMC